jgi:hypothetical protein
MCLRRGFLKQGANLGERQHGLALEVAPERRVESIAHQESIHPEPGTREVQVATVHRRASGRSSGEGQVLPVECLEGVYTEKL